MKNAVQYRECRDCGFRFSLPEINPNLANTITDYESSYLQYLGPEPADAANIASLRAWMERFRLLRGARVLDVGAGGGKLVRELRAFGAVAEGLEPSRALFDHFLADDPAFTFGMLDDYRRTSTRRFDVITAFDVIEHVAEPSLFLADVAALLQPGGLFFASTPDAASLVAKVFGSRWHFYYPYHLSYFSQETLRAAAAKHGLTLLDVRHRGKLRSLGYMFRYVAEFIGGGSAPRWASWFDSWYLPVNLFDVMYLCFRRDAA